MSNQIMTLLKNSIAASTSESDDSLLSMIQGTWENALGLEKRHC